jgi:DnaJ-domain-containing protein 1
VSLFKRIQTLRDTAQGIGRSASRAVYDYAMEQPRVRRRVNMAKTLLEEARHNVEDRFDGIERELWDWIREMQAQAQRAQQQVNRARDSDDYYRILGLKPGAHIDAVKTAWRQKMRENHPDRFTSDPIEESRAQERAQEINHAYRELRILLTGR